jgi:hypothetical protein
MQTMPPKITDYWDSTTTAIDIQARTLGALSLAERQDALALIAAGVQEQVRVLNDQLLVTVAIAVADDLYKSACWIDRWAPEIADYLEASAGTFWTAFSARGFTLHQLIDNTFDDLERPLAHFPGWFQAAGLTYVCPQAIAADLIHQIDGEDVPIAQRLPAYIDEARDLVESILNRCRSESRHYLLLELDFDERSFHTPLASSDEPGILTTIRNEGAQPGTDVGAVLPANLRASN